MMHSGEWMTETRCRVRKLPVHIWIDQTDEWVHVHLQISHPMQWPCSGWNAYPNNSLLMLVLARRTPLDLKVSGSLRITKTSFHQQQQILNSPPFLPIQTHGKLHMDAPKAPLKATICENETEDERNGKNTF